MGFISEARRNRKILGGGMRQAGIIAAAGIVAVEKMIERLREDHDNARLLAQGISCIPGLAVDLSRVMTNILYFDLDTDKVRAEDLVSEMNRKGIKFLSTGPRRFRMVTHYGISREDIEASVRFLAETMSSAA
jgi:threonine aldolase